MWEIVAGKSCGKLLRENLAEILCGKILQEILVGNGGGEKAKFKKGSDWWKFSIWNRVMGSQPISIQLRKILRELCGKILREILAGKSCGKFLWEIVVGKSCRKFLWEILVGNGGGEKANLRKTVIGGNLAFGIG